MKFENKGNLGRVDLLDRLISKKYFNDEYEFTKEEMKEISYQLKKFNNLLSNLFLYENQLKTDGYSALVSLLDESEMLYRNYDPETAEDPEHVF